MTPSRSRQFADDAPKSNPWQDDALGFRDFSARLAEALVRQNAPNGYVFGLHGEWGSGKSTVLNFVRSHFHKWHEESCSDIATLEWFDFEPWIVSGHQDLAAAFFKVLSEKLGDGTDRRATARRLAKGAIDAGADKLIDAAAKLGVVIDHTGGTASKAGAAVTKLAVKKAAERWLAEPSLQKSYDELVIRLRASERRFVVFVDDIDRLTSSEIRSLMQMVKTVGRLPNVTYCLSYDRQIVWAALGELAPGDGKRSGYAEKIVQHEVEVPVPSRTGLMKMLEAALPDLPSGQAMGIRWIEMLRAGIFRWIRHPRDVVRLSNAMHFACAALRDEVDAYDMLCMEALRLFDRKAFDWVRDNSDLLLGEGLPSMRSEEEAARAADELARSLGEDARADIVPILRLLFPNRANLFGSRRGLSSEQWSQVVIRRGIATKAGFRAYFSLSPSPNAVPKRLIEEGAAPSVARERQIELIDIALALKDDQGTSLVGEYFQELSYRVPAMGAPDLVALLQALTDRSVAVFAEDGESGLLGPASAHHVITGLLLERLGPEAAADALDAIFAGTENVGALAALYVDMARALGAIVTDGLPQRDYIPAERLPALGQSLLPKIEREATADRLSALPYYYDVARAWAHLGDLPAARLWLAQEARRDGHSLAKLSKGLLGRSNDGARTQYGLYRDPETDIYDVDAIEEGCRLYDGQADLSEVEQARIRALKDGIVYMRVRQARSRPNDEEH
ncbi:KAP family P-loop NTPase fold protein [Sphingomonas oryzagri]